MTKVVFFTDAEHISGFSISGHSSKSCGDLNGKLVCSAVSSAAYMAANTILEVIGDKSIVDISDAKMELKLAVPNEATDIVLKGFKLHIEQLAEQYSNNIKISEV